MNTENMGEGETLIHRQWECKLGSYKKCVYKQTKFHSLSTKSHHLEKTEIEAEILGSNKISQTETHRAVRRNKDALNTFRNW